MVILVEKEQTEKMKVQEEFQQHRSEAQADVS